MTTNSASAVTTLPILQTLELENRYFKFPNEILDEIGLLDPYELSAYSHLLRLTRGFHRASKRVSLDRLSERTRIGRTKLKGTIRSLQAKGLVAVEEVQGRSNSYTVFIPRELPDWLEPPVALSDVAEDDQIPTTPPTQGPSDVRPNSAHLTIEGVHNPTSGSHDTTPRKDKIIEKEIQNNTQAPVGVDGPVLSLKAVTDGAGFVSPLENLTEGALALAYKLAPAWTVLRILITLLVSYLSSSVLNPVGLLRWALKSKDFVALSDTDIANTFVQKIRWFVAHVHPAEKHYFKTELQELPELEAWLNKNFDSVTLQELWKQYHELCPATSKNYNFIWFFVITDPRKLKNRS